MTSEETRHFGKLHFKYTVDMLLIDGGWFIVRWDYECGKGHVTEKTKEEGKPNERAALAGQLHRGKAASAKG